MENKKVTLSEVIQRFREYNEQHNLHYGCKCSDDVPIISAVIVYKQSSFTKEYSEQSRSYRVTNLRGKAFFNGMLGNSILGDCLDGSDEDVRLDAVPWEVDYCYFESEVSE